MQTAGTARGPSEPGSGEQCLDKFVGVKDVEIVYPFADSDHFNGYTELALNGNQHTPFGGTVELGKDNARHSDGVGKLAGLLQTVLSGRRIKY